jgi:single-stranded-DNA-specific exonuclease
VDAVQVNLTRGRQALLNAAAVVPHVDADGLAAGAIALRARGERAGDAVLLGRGETPFQPGVQLPDGPLAILDWGVRPLARPAVFADHHAPESAPRDDQIVVSGYGEVPETATAPLLRRLVPDAPAWLVAVGAVGDHGPAGLRLPECAGAPATAVRRLAGLVNAPHRMPDGPVATALALLVEHDDPTEALLDPRVAQLEDCKRAWKAEFDGVLRVPPLVHEDVALVRFSSPCLIQSLVATTWARRLAPRVVLAANDGSLPGRVEFALRGGEGSLLALLRAALPDTDSPEFAHGHDRATGGSLPPEEFARLLSGLGLGGAAPAAA